MRAPLLLLVLALAACEREDRAYRPQPVATQTDEKIAQSPLSPGPTGPIEWTSGKGQEYENNAYHVSQGKRLYTFFNCVGCHAHGGGGSGPALMDDLWIYGGKIEHIVQTIREGRPNGMPSFRGKIVDDQIWQIAAYVRSMSGNIRKDVAPARSDDMHPRPAENREIPRPPVQGGFTPPAGQMPQ
jgi:cytochrome c oxidase cbb3-type subunit 3